MKKVYVGLSGGVDSSVAAVLLKQQGYRVVGAFMKNWSQSLPGFTCPWRDDYYDAKRIAVQLDIEFELFDFETTYKQKVVDYMIQGFKSGLTPNPDIMCNQEIKFKMFLNTALQKGADFIATGHYARTEGGKLYKAKDSNKDQTYFLYRVTSEALKKTLFPLGDFTKPQVREIAKKYNLITAGKKESMGICFIGKVPIKDFLLNYVQPQAGNIIDQYGRVIGQHDGAIFYTIGQRHGLDVGGGLPYYVVGKDMKKNEVYVSTQLNDDKLWLKELALTQLHWINQPPKLGKKYQIRTRHRAPLVNCTFQGQTLEAITLDEPVRAITPGQSLVVYDNQEVLGGGIII